MLFEYGIVVYMMTVILLLITGYLLYWLIRHPIKSLGLILKTTVLLSLGIIVWLGLFYWVTI